MTISQRIYYYLLLLLNWLNGFHFPKPKPEPDNEENKTEMADFNIAYPIIERWEGGYQNNVNDKGNWIDPVTLGWVTGSEFPYSTDSGVDPVLIGTNRGVTAPGLAFLFGRLPTEQEMRNLSYNDAKDYFFRKFWVGKNIDSVDDQQVANILLDGVVQHSVGVRLMQEVLGVTPDNRMGPITLNAINTSDPETVFNQYKIRREAYYRTIVANRPSQRVFLNGWLNRINSFNYIPTTTPPVVTNPPTSSGSGDNLAAVAIGIGVLYLIFGR